MSIKIIYYTEVIDNWGRTESSRDGEKIRSVLTTPENWNDDMTFEGDDGKVYFIDDLLDKEVTTNGVETFIVPNDLI